MKRMQPKLHGSCGATVHGVSLSVYGGERRDRRGRKEQMRSNVIRGYSSAVGRLFVDDGEKIQRDEDCEKIL